MKRLVMWLALVSGFLVVAAFLTHQLSKPGVRPIQAAAQSSPKTFKELLAIPASDIGKHDIAVLNLLSAQGLPGSENINTEKCSATLDQWAARVKSETERHLYRFRNNPAEYENSEAYFRMLMMAVVVYEDFGVRYNPERLAPPPSRAANDHFFADSRDIFLHGLIGDRRMGTCSSMPVLYAALGRRLGYPLKLVTTKAHLFLRWEDGKERFDLEATGQGMDRYDDEHFKRFPFPVTEEEIQAEGYMKSLTAAEELAVFLSIRGMCLMETGRFGEAKDAFGAAAKLAPSCRTYGVMRDEMNQKISSSAIAHSPRSCGSVGFASC